MYIRIAIHEPYPDKKDDLARMMRQFGEAFKDASGLIGVFGLRDTLSDRMVGLALWKDEKSYQAARQLMDAGLEGMDFSDIEGKPPDIMSLVFHGEALCWASWQDED